ncbi:MAG: hypothetical protein AB8G77_06645 [Rhodothermales bacterium]
MKSKTLFLVVPGVGSEEKGATVRNFAHSYAIVSGDPIVDSADELVLSDDDALSEDTITSDAPNPSFAQEEDIEVFSVPTLTSTSATKQNEFAELYWDDLSNVKGSLWGIVKGIFEVILGLRYLIPPLEKYGKAIWPARFSRLFFMLLRGPILALSTIAVLNWVIIDLVFIARSQFEKIGYTAEVLLDEHVATMLGIFNLMLFFVLLALLKLGKNPFFKNWTCKFLLVLSFIYATILLFKPEIGFFSYTDSLGMFASLYASSLGGLWFVENMLLFLILVLVLPASLFKGTSRNSQFTCVLLPLLSMMFWMALMTVTLVGMYLATPENMQFGLQEKLLSRSLPTAGWIFAALLIIAIVAGIVWFIRSMMITRALNESTGNYTDKDPLRIVLNPAVSMTIYAVTIFLIPIALAVLWTNEFALPIYMQIALPMDLVEIRTEVNSWINSSWLMMTIREWTPAINGYVIVMITALIPIFNYNKAGVQQGLGIFLDVINYFRPSPVQEYAWRINTYDKLEFSVRNKILNRLRKVTGYYTDISAGDSKYNLVVVAHSQGTVLALDFLTNPAYNQTIHKFKSVKLVTMGSPYSHIYEHYFPGLFNEIVPFNREVHVEKSNWINIYRSDDYIGTHISVKNEIGAPAFLGLPMNVEIGRGSHTGYFKDKRVIPKIYSFVNSKATVR